MRERRTWTPVSGPATLPTATSEARHVTDGGGAPSPGPEEERSGSGDVVPLERPGGDPDDADGQPERAGHVRAQVLRVPNRALDEGGIRRPLRTRPPASGGRRRGSAGTSPPPAAAWRRAPRTAPLLVQVVARGALGRGSRPADSSYQSRVSTDSTAATCTARMVVASSGAGVQRARSGSSRRPSTEGGGSLSRHASSSMEGGGRGGRTAAGAVRHGRHAGRLDAGHLGLHPRRGHRARACPDPTPEQLRSMVGPPLQDGFADALRPARRTTSTGRWPPTAGATPRGAIQRRRRPHRSSPGC